MTIEEALESDFKDALRARRSDAVACIRSVKAKIQEAVTAKGFTGPKDDALYRRVITAYVKSLQKAVEELRATGERGRALSAQYEAETAYLDRFVPKLASDAETRELVERTLAEMGPVDPKRSGQVIGAVMKAHKDRVDPAIVRKIVEEKLAGGG